MTVPTLGGNVALVIGAATGIGRAADVMAADLLVEGGSTAV